VKINVQANANELFAAGNYSNLDFVFPEFVGGKTDDWNSVYYTFDPFYPMKKEMFFQRNDVVKHSSMEFLSSKMPKAERTYLQYHHEYNRWERHTSGGSGQIRSDLLARETLTVATIYLRATSSRIVYDERQVKTLYDFPKDAGGFWTASLFFGACCHFLLQLVFPKRVATFLELLQRAERSKTLQHEMDSVSDTHCTAKGELAYVASRAPSADADGANSTLTGKQCEINSLCQHLGKASAVEPVPAQLDDAELRSKQYEQHPSKLIL
jgi:hypothetical protein